jgi:hypothetical protein
MKVGKSIAKTNGGKERQGVMFINVDWVGNFIPKR